jgi:hypothetical protein
MLKGLSFGWERCKNIKNQKIRPYWGRLSPDKITIEKLTFHEWELLADRKKIFGG